MKNTWFAADLHFRHRGATEQMTRKDGRKLRPFASVEETDEAIIERFNALVKDGDELYILGDLAFNSTGLNLIDRLNGRKRAVLGNHDNETPARYARHFYKVYGAKSMEVTEGVKVVLTHVPVHPSCLTRWKLNVHGHLHDERVMIDIGGKPSVFEDPRYLCASVEQNDFRPFHLDEVIERARRCS